MKRNSLLAVAIFIILVGPVGYTFGNAMSLPHAANLKVTGAAFSEEVLNTENSTGGLHSLNSYNSTLSSLAYHEFTVAGSNATFGFSLHYLNERMSYFGYSTYSPFVILITKTQQSIGFPYYGTLMLEIDNINLTTVFQVNGTQTHDPGEILIGVSQSYNNSVAGYFFLYSPSIPFTTLNASFAQSNHMELASNYSITYRIQVTPVVEFGPYHYAGKTQWVSHTFEYPQQG